jgi:hypothetical protein
MSKNLSDLFFTKNDKITKINQYQITKKSLDSVEGHVIINYTAYQSEIVKILCNNVNPLTISLQLYHNKTFLHMRENNNENDNLLNLKMTYKKMYNLNNKLKYLENKGYWIHTNLTSLPSSLIYITEEIINDERKNKTCNLSNLPNKIKFIVFDIPRYNLNKKIKLPRTVKLQTSLNT